MEVCTATSKSATIGLGEGSRFEARRGRHRIMVDLIRVTSGEVAMTGEYMRFGRPTGRRPGRDGEIVVHVGDYRLMPFEVAKCVESLVAELG